MGTTGMAIRKRKAPVLIGDDMLLLDAFDRFLDETGMAPMDKELAERLNIPRNTIRGAVRRLEQAGLIDKDGRKQRGSWITPDGFDALESWRNQREAKAVG